MKLLFITQSTIVEDGVVSFVSDWIEESQKNFERSTSKFHLGSIAIKLLRVFSRPEMSNFL